MLNESSFKLKFDFYVHTTWKIKFHQSVNCFLSWVDDVDKTFVFPLLVVLLSPFVWYTNQSGVDGIRGTHFLLNPFVF